MPAKPADSLPKAQGVGEHRGQLGMAVEEDPLVGHEHVVEDHEAVGHVLAAGDRETPLVLVPRRVVDVDDLHAGRIGRDHAGDRIVVLAGLHRLCRDGHKFMRQRGGGDVQLGAADHHAVRPALDDMDVGVGIVLLRSGRLERSPLGVSDALHDAHVADLGVLDPGAYALRRCPAAPASMRSAAVSSVIIEALVTASRMSRSSDSSACSRSSSFEAIVRMVSRSGVWDSRRSGGHRGWPAGPPAPLNTGWAARSGTRSPSRYTLRPSFSDWRYCSPGHHHGRRLPQGSRAAVSMNS